MTDIMKLATDYAQACYHLANPESYDAERAEEARAALQAAIEALQAECAEHKDNAMRNARIAVNIKSERDTLRAQLEAIQRHGPVALEDEMLDTAISWCDSNGINVLGPEELSSLVRSLCITVRDTSTKALEPLTEDRIAHLWAFAWTGDRVAFVRAVEAAHGIQAKGGQHEDA